MGSSKTARTWQCIHRIIRYFFIYKNEPSGSSSSCAPIPRPAQGHQTSSLPNKTVSSSLDLHSMQSFPAMQFHPEMLSLHDYMRFPSPMSMSRRSRIQRACIACRKRKIKCNGDLDGCAHCAEKGQKCRYEPVPDGEKLKARSYKRQLIQRRQQTRVYFDRRQLPDPMMYAAAAYGMGAPYPIGFYGPQPAMYPGTQAPQMHQLASPFASPSSSISQMDQDLNPYFASAAPPMDSSVQLQNITGTSSFSSSSSSSHSIPAPLVLESLNSSSNNASALSCSLSSPTLSVSSSSSSLLTPMSETFSELNTPLTATFPSSAQYFEQMNDKKCHHNEGCCSGPNQIHFHDFAGGLELYNVPCMAPVSSALVSSTSPEDFAMATMGDSPVLASLDASALSSPQHILLPLPANFDFNASSALLLESAAPSTLAGAFA